MRTYPVEFTPEFREQIENLYDYIAEEASPDIAERYTGAIVSYCESLCTFPHRGTMRDDLLVAYHPLQGQSRDRLRCR